MNTNWCLSKLAATLSATVANWDEPQAASTPCVFTVCATQRELDAASTIEKKTVKMLIRQTISPSQRYSRSLTPELTGRAHNCGTDKLTIKAALFALRLNELLGCVGRRLNLRGDYQGLVPIGNSNGE